MTVAWNAVAARPRLWVYGALGFSLRGGIVVLAAPIIVLPTQVEARAILGSNLGSTGFTDAFWILIAGASLATTAEVVLGALCLATLERGAYEDLFGRLISGAARRDLLFRLFMVQLLAVLALALSAVPLALAIGEVTYGEIIRPSSSASIYSRVLAGAAQPLILFGLAVLVVELVSAVATREVLAGRSRLAGRSEATRHELLDALLAALIRPFRYPVRTLATAAMGWLITAAAVLAVAVLVALAWRQVRGAYLTSLTLGDPRTDAAMFVVAVALAGAFALGLIATGFAAALRGALWSVERLS